MTSEADIVIIGAGAAGVGAARGLAGQGLKVLLLDALPRLGGRAWTATAAGVPLDMGCAYLHSADRNPWVAIAESLGIEVDRGNPAWGKHPDTPYFSAADQRAARAAFEAFYARLDGPRPASDCAADLLDPADARWLPVIQALCGYISGAGAERLSVEDLANYEAVSTDLNWRPMGGYGALVAAALPKETEVHLSTPVEALSPTPRGVTLRTPQGEIGARAAILTVSTGVLSQGRIALPPELAPWQEAAAGLPLGNDEKLFFETLEPEEFETETYFYGDPTDPGAGSCYVRPHGKPVIEYYLGGSGARVVAEAGHEAAWEMGRAQLTQIFGSAVLERVRPLVATDWARTPEIGGGYSYATPGRAAARQALARPFDGRVFFAGEATETGDYSTAHGALMSGQRAAREVRAALGR